MKIGISCYPTFGGSGVVASELGMGLAERGHEVHFITYAQPGRLDLYRPGIYYHEVTVPDYPLFEYAPYELALASKMADCALREGLHLIHAHYAIPHAASALLAQEMVGAEKLKVVTTLHGTDITLVGRDPSFLRTTMYTIERSDAVTAVSHFLHREVCRTFTCNKDVRVIHNFVDPRAYRDIDPEPTRSRLAPNGERLLIHISNFRPVKRVLDVAETFLRIRRRMPVKLILVGTGPELPNIVQKIQGQNADHDLIMLGNQNRIVEIIAAADVMLLPSESESFGLVALEAMACKVPPVVSNAGGLPELVDDGSSGYLLPVGDLDGLEGRVFQLLTDEPMRKRMGQAAQEVAFERFSFEKALDQYENLYRELVQV